MKKEKSAGAVVFKIYKNEPRYLLLKSVKGHWGMIKGHIEEGEKLTETAMREFREETGLDDLEFFSGFKKTIGYFFNFQGNKIGKTVVYFLARVRPNKKVRLSVEHDDYKWLDFEKAIKKLTFENDRGVLKEACDFLKNKSPFF